VSLRILFADDSMTAQNMGKKILSEAGYDVVAVSNGAAAVKKIAEQKPDIIILDVYMPGYSGLEVCEKVRGSLDTLKTPVLLTVGKMEPYKPEDANRVKADGVIIKPFEASDLLAIVKKFEERIAHVVPVPPIVEQTVRLERQYQEEAITAPEPPMEHHSTGKTGVQPMVEVPDHMASSAAFTDMLGGDLQSAPQHFAVNTPAAAFETSVIVPAPPVPATDYELPVSWKDDKDEEEPTEAIAAMPAEAEHEIVAMPTAAPEPAAEIAAPEPQASTMPVETFEHEPRHPQFIPVFKEPEPEPESTAATSYEVMPTSAPPVTGLDIPREPALQETADIATRNTVVDRVEPGLLSTIEQQMETRVDTPAETAAVSSADENSVSAASEEATTPAMEVAPAESYSAPLPKINATSEVSDSDFEARVAAAMAAYSHAAEPASASSHVAVAESPVSAQAAAPAPSIPAPSVDEAPAAEMPHAVVAEHVPSFEYQPPVRVPEPEPVEQAASVPEVAAEPVPTPSAPEPVAAEPAAIHDALASSVEAAAVEAAAKTGEEHHTIAQAVHRVMERLKPELVDEIMRELKSKK
jgi:CheY-like chemotaxis protein